MKTINLSSLVATVVIPLLIAAMAYQWFGGQFGPSQALAYSSLKAVVALSIFFAYLRLMNLLNGIRVSQWFTELHKRDQANIYCIRLAAVGLIVAACFFS